MLNSPTISYQDVPAININPYDSLSENPAFSQLELPYFSTGKTKSVNGDNRNKLTLSHLNLVGLIAQHYKNNGLPFLDLVQEGAIGLMTAIEKFDPQKGNKLSTYASWWIKQSMTRALSNKSRIIRIPVHVLEAIAKIQKAKAQLQNQYKREPLRLEVASAMKTKLSKIDSILNLSLPCISLDYSGYEDGNLNPFEVVQDNDSLSPEDTADFHFLKKQMEKVMDDVLDDREKSVLRLRFGLDSSTGFNSLERIGLQLNLTRNQTRKASASAMRKLRKKLKRASFEEYLM